VPFRDVHGHDEYLVLLAIIDDPLRRASSLSMVNPDAPMPLRLAPIAKIMVL